MIELLAVDMAAHLNEDDDTYTAMNGVMSTLSAGEAYACTMPTQLVVTDPRFEQMDHGPRVALATSSDGTTREAIRFFPVEILICEGDLMDKTVDEIRSLQGRRDRDCSPRRSALLSFRS